MKKFLIFFFYVTICFSKEVLNDEFDEDCSDYLEYNELNIVSNYENWKTQLLDLSSNDNFRKLQKLQSLSEVQNQELEMLYRSAQYKTLIEREVLKNDLIRAKIYYYYYRT
ncbi:MAG: hypothetical protein ACRCZ9_07255, partial [Fusobacteriaceae bacterium]